MIKETTNKDEIKAIFCHPDIYSRLGEDGMPSPEEWEPPKEAIYLIDNDLGGLMIYHWTTSVCLECHIHILPEHRDTGFEFGQKALMWAWECTKATKIVAQIPEIYPDVLKFALKNGFEIEGLNESSYQKNGNIIDQVNVGIKRP